MGKVLGGLEPKPVWDYFEEILQHPHPSKKEDKLAEFILNWAKDHNFETQKDKLGNIVVRKPATKGMEDRKPFVIQGHIDMVCEKNSDVEFDFENDAIQPWIDGDWVKAKGTTLGADNGLGIAMAMAIMDSDDIPHPDMEMLCTLDEETGLTGAMQLGKDLLKSEILINLDSEEDGHFTIGCAGGQNTSGTFKYQKDDIPADTTAFELGVKGLMGGHSGIEIHDGRANAIKFLNRALWEAGKKFEFRLSTFDAGSAHNAIPREAFAKIVVKNSDVDGFKSWVDEFDKTIKAEYSRKEPGILAVAKQIDGVDRVMTKDMQEKFVRSIYAMPHGPNRYSPDIEGLVQTSTNLAVVKTRENDIFILTSQRSSVETEKKDMATAVRASLELGGAEVEQGDGYPAWEPNPDSPILNAGKKVFEDIFGKPPVIEAIHAGLECGLVGEKYPHMDMISFGPTLKDVHSPDEKVSISTSQNCWKLLLGIVENLPKK